MKAEFQVQSRHTVYPTLSEKLHIAIGATGTAWGPLKYSRDYDRLGSVELDELANAHTLDKRELGDLLNEIRHNRPAAIKHLKKLAAPGPSSRYVQRMTYY